MIVQRLDRRLLGLSTSTQFTYTAYANDLTFSPSGEAAAYVGGLIERVTRIVVDEGFTVQRDQVRVQRRSMRQEVRGVIVNDGVRVPRHEPRALRAILHDVTLHGFVHANRHNRVNLPSWLRGKPAHVAMVDPARGWPMLHALDAAAFTHAPN